MSFTLVGNVAGGKLAGAGGNGWRAAPAHHARSPTRGNDTEPRVTVGGTTAAPLQPARLEY